MSEYEPHQVNREFPVPAPDPTIVDLTPVFLERRSRILDAGSGRGRNAIFLAQAGHEVIGLEQELDYLADSQRYVRELGGKALDLSFVKGDICNPPFEPASFDAVLLTGVLQEVGSHERVYQALVAAQKLTVSGGYNFITAHIGTEYHQNLKPELQILYPGEIEETYESQGWHIRHANRQISPLQEIHDVQFITSRDTVVAQKP